MIAKYLVVGAIATVLVTGTAISQTAAPVAGTNSTAAVNRDYRGQWRVYKVIGLDVYNESNERLGDISELLTDQSGKIQTAILGVGGFLGMGERQVAISFDRLKFVNEPVVSTTASNAPAATTTTGSATSVRPARTASEQWYPDHAVVGVTREQLKAMPEFKYN